MLRLCRKQRCLRFRSSRRNPQQGWKKAQKVKAIRLQDADLKLDLKVGAKADPSRRRSCGKVLHEFQEKRRKKWTIRKSTRSSKMKLWFTRTEVEAVTLRILQDRITSTWVTLLQMMAISCSLPWVSEEMLSNRQTLELQCIAVTNITLLRQLLLGFGKISLRHTSKMLSLLRAALGLEIISKQKTRGQYNTNFLSDTAILTKLATPAPILADTLSRRAPPIQEVGTAKTLTSRRFEISPAKAGGKKYRSQVERASWLHLLLITKGMQLNRLNLQITRD